MLNISNNRTKNSNVILSVAKNLFVFILIGLTINSCKVGPNFEKSKVATAPTFRYDSIQSDTVVNLRWWELFNNKELDSLILIGLQENKDVLQAASRVQQAMINVGFTKADQYPGFGATVQANLGNVIGNQPLSGDAGVYIGGVTLNWEIDFWGKFRRATEAAKANFVASDYAKRTIQIGLISAITQTYFQLLDFKWRLEIAEETVVSRQRGLQIIQDKFDGGLVPQIDLDQSQIQLSIAEASVPLYKRQVAITETALAILLGRNPYEINNSVSLINQGFPADIPPGIPSTLLERRPDILVAENRFHAETANVGVAEASRFPSISLTGLVGGVASQQLSSAVTGGFAWSASAGLISPLINWGKNKKRAEIQKEVALQSAYAYENTVINAFKEVEDALVTISTSKVELAARQKQVEAALSARDLSLERYNGGVTSYLEVIENDRSAFEAELQYSQVRQQLLNSYILLYKALGGGWITAQEEQAVQEAANQNQGN
jgi:outer membrane protein, multidrug efflux system